MFVVGEACGFEAAQPLVVVELWRQKLLLCEHLLVSHGVEQGYLDVQGGCCHGAVGVHVRVVLDVGSVAADSGAYKVVFALTQSCGSGCKVSLVNRMLVIPVCVV